MAYLPHTIRAGTTPSGRVKRIKLDGINIVDHLENQQFHLVVVKATEGPDGEVTAVLCLPPEPGSKQGFALCTLDEGGVPAMVEVVIRDRVILDRVLPKPSPVKPKPPLQGLV